MKISIRVHHQPLTSEHYCPWGNEKIPPLQTGCFFIAAGFFLPPKEAAFFRPGELPGIYICIKIIHMYRGSVEKGKTQGSKRYHQRPVPSKTTGPLDQKPKTKKSFEQAL